MDSIERAQLLCRAFKEEPVEIMFQTLMPNENEVEELKQWTKLFDVFKKFSLFAKQNSEHIYYYFGGTKFITDEWTKYFFALKNAFKEYFFSTQGNEHRLPKAVFSEEGVSWLIFYSFLEPVSDFRRIFQKLDFKEKQQIFYDLLVKVTDRWHESYWNLACGFTEYPSMCELLFTWMKYCPYEIITELLISSPEALQTFIQGGLRNAEMEGKKEPVPEGFYLKDQIYFLSEIPRENRRKILQLVADFKLFMAWKSKNAGASKELRNDLTEMALQVSTNE